jgi:hypothetical protein
VQAKVELAARGWRQALSVHDEILLCCPKNVEAVRRARHDLLAVAGPGGWLADKWKWSVVLNPHEINVSRSLYEVNQTADWWANLSQDYLEKLP